MVATTQMKIQQYKLGKNNKKPLSTISRENIRIMGIPEDNG